MTRIEDFPVGSTVHLYDGRPVRIELKTPSCAYVSEPAERMILGKTIYTRTRYTISLRAEARKGGKE